jgi:hypothetical protein
MKPVNLFIIFCCFLLPAITFGQKQDSVQKKDTIIVKNDSVVSNQLAKDSIPKKDTVIKKKHDPHKATIYSAILPGAGQVYNKKYWKVPIVWAAIGIPTYTYFYNKSWYQKCQYALAVTVNGSGVDSFNAVAPELKPFVERGDVNNIINYRNEFRKNQDYSALFVLLFWGLNIVDATVDAHLKDFNVNSDLSFKVKPLYIPGPNVAGVSIVFDIHKGKSKLIDLSN